jgi:hypothetical protein
VTVNTSDAASRLDFANPGLLTDPGAPSLSIASGGILTLGTISYVAGNAADGVTINAGGVLDVTGAITALVGEVETITINGGTMELGDLSVGVSSNPQRITFDFHNTGGGVVDFATTKDVFGDIINQSQQHINDVTAGDGIILHDQNFAVTDAVTYDSVLHRLTVHNGGTAAAAAFTMFNVTNVAAGTTFEVLNSDTIEAICYARGTMIRTPEGELPVEKLRPGKQVITLVDGQEVPQTVTWLGHRRIDLTAHARPETARPIRILRDAFADGIPHRDLVVSPDHAIFVDGKLICARQLVNGTTIRQETDWAAVDYYHVELDRHAILLAEGLPAESYIDTGNSGFFDNSGAPLVLHPDLTDESDYPTREAGSCAPFVWDEASVRPVWQCLAERAAALGRPVPQRATTADTDLRLLNQRPKRRTVKPIYEGSELAIFMLPRGASEIRLQSRAQSPTEARPWLEDRRRLGVRVTRIVLRTANETSEVPMDHPGLTEGWWAVERDGQVMSRWTDGDAVVPLPAMSGDVMLEVHLAGSMTYVVEAATERRAA